MWIIYTLLIITVVFFVGKLLVKLTWGDPGTDAAATECAEIAWKLNLAQAQGHGDPEALKHFDKFWVLVTKHSLDHEAIAVASLKTVLNHACKAFEKAFPDNEPKRREAEGYRKNMTSILEDYIETQKLKFQRI